MKKQLTEAAGTTCLAEAGQPGRFRVQIMSAGLGSSGYYPAATLEAAATQRVFPAGTHLYIDHPGAEEREDRPERTLRDLVGVLASDAVYNADTKALEADATIYSQWRDVLGEMADDIGLSIRAWANSGPGQAEGHTGVIVWDLLEALSVDFVTRAGRDGKVLAVLEAARTSVETASNDRRDQLRRAVRDAVNRWAYVLDFDDTTHTVWYDADVDDTSRTWQDTYLPADDDMSVTLTGQPVEVRPVTTFHPVTSAGHVGESAPQTIHQEKPMEITEARYAELTAAADRVTALEAAVAAEKQRAEAAEADARKVARDAYTAQVQAAVEASALPAAARERVAAALGLAESADVPADPTQAIQAAIKAEADYLAAVTPAPRKGLGFNAAAEAATEAYTNPWGRTIDRKGA